MRALGSCGPFRTAIGRTFLWGLLAASACSEPRYRQATEEDPVRLEQSPSAGGAILRLLPAAGVRINARLVPTLELNDGTRIGLVADALTKDSAYFSAPPSAFVTAAQTKTGGSIRVSYCPQGDSVCRTVLLPVTTRPEM